METYEKKYKEANDKIAARFGTNVAKEIFTDLYESEDEKIRKAIIELVRQSSEILGMQNQSNILAWLEKQGKQRDNLIDIDAMVLKYSNTREKETNGLPVNCQIRSYRQGINDTLNLSLNIEKQGYTKKDVDDAYLKGICDAKHELEKQGEEKPADKAEPKFKVKYAGNEYNVFEIRDINGVTYYGIEDEPNHIDYVKAENCEIISGYAIKENGSPYPTKPAMFSEKTPANKVDPKFHEGDWIVWQNKCYKVNDNGCGYELIDQNGLSTSLEYGTVDASARFYDVSKDAKDGDVLYSHEHNLLWIYKNKEECHVAINLNYTNSISFGTDIVIPSDICPATKEQRDLLFQKMKEEGYEWSEETHELKKISQRIISAEAKEALYDKPTDEEMKELLRTEYEKGRADTIAEMEKDWSEEDDVMINKLLAVVKLYYDRSGDDLDKQSCISFLKSIKDKVQPQPKQKWNEEDEDDLNNIIWLCNNCINGSETTWIPSQAIRIKSLIERIKDTVFLQPKQEWNEEDEKMVGNIRSIIEKYAFSQSAVDVNGDLCEKIYIDADNWIKSIKQRIGG